ncbi:hypothetical protein OV079_40695 [Nannocystis pusilla]|uniref:HEPN domain-containing protein n=1 Tax=Nannocystis pusilla TaxID=889268 RepID=A0A9X3EWQ8_9BACT|nr:hypothetical protein [Nannocystis pusilla]MCY1011768.1 hypothetical protein [Nannocystis pusilla]
MITPDELWSEALRQCGEASTTSATEAARRLAIAALYYATYHAAGRVVAVDTTASNSNHERLFAALRDSREVAVQRAALRYRSLKALRVRSHYYLREHVGSQDLGQAQHHARAVRTLLRLDSE